MKKDWKYKKLGEVTTTINGLWTGKKPPFVNVAVVRNTNFTKDCKLDMTNVAYLDVEEKQFSTRKLQYGDIIIEKSGGSEKQPVGRPVLFNINEGDYSFSNFTSTLRINNKEELDPHFLHYSLVGAYFRGVTGKMQAKTTGIHNLDFKAYLKLLIPTPSLPEQQQIVAELDLLSGMIEKQKAQIEELDKLSQSIFYDMFGDPVNNDKGWDVKKLKEICSKITDGTHNSPTNDAYGAYMYITAKNIKESGLSLDNITYVSEEVHRSIYERCNPVYGDVLYIKDGATTGIAVVNNLKEEFSLLSSVALLKPGPQLVNQYLKAVLNNPSEYKCIRSNMGGAAITRLTIKKIEGIEIPLPPLSLQQEFAAKIEAIEAMKAKVRQSLKESETLFNSRMDYYFN